MIHTVVLKVFFNRLIVKAIEQQLTLNVSSQNYDVSL